MKVRPLMPPEVISAGVSFPTERTRERPWFLVGGSMSGEILVVIKGFVTSIMLASILAVRHRLVSFRSRLVVPEGAGLAESMAAVAAVRQARILERFACPSCPTRRDRSFSSRCRW
jgi:hypothetical protein